MAELRKYLRDKNGQPRGVLVAIGAGQIGWSVAHPSDKFDKELGVRIARGRAQVYGQSWGNLPKEYHADHTIMKLRSFRYFK